MKYYRSIPESESGNHLNACKADDTPIPFVGFACEKCFEVYSGNTDSDLTGGVDETPEQVTVRINDANQQVIEWSVMRAGDARHVGATSQPRLAYSSEELSTIDFDKVPSRSP